MKKIIYILILAGLLTACSNKTGINHSPTVVIAENYLAKNGFEDVKLLIDSADACLSASDAFRIKGSGSKFSIISPSESGLLYGAFEAVRLKHAGKDPAMTDTIVTPFYSLRIVDHWDNPDGTVERGYAGQSLWKWNELPDTLSPLYGEYAMRLAETGTNGIVLNNVNASPQILSVDNLRKVKSLADFFRDYGVKIYLSVNFASPMVIDTLSTADPLETSTFQWWHDKADEIYSLIPDFGGFLVKANSEGQPGPGDYGRSHADGANMLARALKPYGGIVMWRAFVYSPSSSDRAMQAYEEFHPLDGTFEDNVIVQVKNGPIDFQPREPYSPLFGAMQHTPLMAEFQITQEYLGHANHLAYLAPMWEEFFTYVEPSSLVSVAGVANIGDGKYMTGHPLADANRYAFGRLSWNPHLSSGEIIEEWLNAHLFLEPTEVPESVRKEVKKMFLESREAVVDYMMPLGLHHIFAGNHHYGPEPWYYVEGIREDWTPRYYHKADKKGLGFDRTSTGSNAVSQYPDSLAVVFEDINRCPEEYLLWFHHVPWDYKMKSGKTMWEELCYSYQRGVDAVDRWTDVWDRAEPFVDADVYADVKRRLTVQAKDARWWRDACLLYFGRFSGMELPEGVEKPEKTLKDFMAVKLPITNFESPTEVMLDKVR